MGRLRSDRYDVVLLRVVCGVDLPVAGLLDAIRDDWSS